MNDREVSQDGIEKLKYLKTLKLLAILFSAPSLDYTCRQFQTVRLCSPLNRRKLCPPQQFLRTLMPVGKSQDMSAHIDPRLFRSALTRCCLITFRGGDLGGLEGWSPQKFEVGDGPCIRSPNILRSSVVGCARNYEKSKKGVIKKFFCLK